MSVVVLIDTWWRRWMKTICICFSIVWRRFWGGKLVRGGCIEQGTIKQRRCGTTNANTFQMVLAADSSVTFNYINIVSMDGIVGLSTGNGAVDPGASDLSAGPVMTAGGNVVYEEFVGNNDLGTAQLLPDLANLTNPIIGTNFDLIINNGAGSIGDFYLLGNPSSFDLSPLGIPCSLETDGILATISTAPGAGYTLAVPNLPGLVGQSLNTQGAVLDPGAGNPFFVLFSNAIDFTFGDI